MADRIVALDPMAQVEERMGLRPVSELLAERETLVERVADLRARHGSFGTYGDLRKIELSRIAMMLRAQAVKDGIKVTEGGIEDAAHAHPDYVAFVTAATLQRAEWVRLENQIEAIEATIRRGQSVASYLSAEARL